MPAPLTTQSYVERATNVWNGRYSYARTLYENSTTKITVTCGIHGDFETLPANHLHKGAGCQRCGSEQRRAKNALTNDQFIERSRILHGNKYDYSKVRYVNQRTLVIIGCPIHGEYSQLPMTHILGHGCRACGGCVASQDDFITKARNIHGDYYGYDKVVYVQALKKVIITCPSHGDFSQVASSHLEGNGCRKCANERISSDRLSNTDDFVHKSKAKHGEKYRYDNVTYKTATMPVEIICLVHGAFMQKPYSHLSGNGCPYCQGVIRTTDRFVEKAKLVHGARYSYEAAEYRNSLSKIIINCADHGDFSVIASEFLRGSGCPGCMVSHPEITWLNSIGVTERQKKIRLGRKHVVVDGYDAATNTVYEFHGDFWHGNPAVYDPSEVNAVRKLTFGELHTRTVEREKLIRQAGYNLVVMWESDWRSNDS